MGLSEDEKQLSTKPERLSDQLNETRISSVNIMIPEAVIIDELFALAALDKRDFVFSLANEP